jgi:ABC-type uncharacterized transport system substrate-binding protein
MHDTSARLVERVLPNQALKPTVPASSVSSSPCRRFSEAQPAGKPVKIGVLSPQSRKLSLAVWDTFRQALRDLGWEDGRNIVIELRFSEGKNERLRGLAEELLRLNVSLIVAVNSPGARAAIDATKTVPIVMVSTSDASARGGGAGGRSIRRSRRSVRCCCASSRTCSDASSPSRSRR